MYNLLPYLRREDQPLALLHGTSRTAGDYAGAPPRRPLTALPGGGHSLEQLKRWFRRFIAVRDAQGSERCLLSAIAEGAPPAALAEMLFQAATDHVYVDGGHALDFCAKAFEALDGIGWEHAAQVLPSLLRNLAFARRSEESVAWRHPVDLIAILEEATAGLPQLLAEGEGRSWQGGETLVPVLLGDDPHAIAHALREALRRGAALEELARRVAYAAALRIARFATSNEFSDWITALHTFTYCNAVHQAVRRAPTWEVGRGIFHGAMAIYLDRFLNRPPAPLPEERQGAVPVDAGEGEELEALLEHLNRRHQVEACAFLVHRYLSRGADPGPLLATLGHALLREDAEFHTYQMVEAAVRQFHAWGGGREGRHILVACARYLAAHSPTDRARHQTATTALRLHRGENIYEERRE